MNIAVNNIDDGLTVELSKICDVVDVVDKPKGVFIQWSTPDNKSLFVRQTNMIEKCIKNKLPMIIFDGDQKISPDEASFLVSEGAFLWESSVSDRMFFSYQPVWGEIKTPDKIPLIDKPTGVDLVYMSPLTKKLSTFKRYYQPMSELGGYDVLFFDSVGNQTINRKVEEMGINITSESINFDIKSLILLGTDHEYQTGRLDPYLFNYLESGILPLLPIEHRWYHSVFDGMVVGTDFDVEYILKTWDKISFGSICDIYKNLDIYLPECNVKNVAKRIVNYFS